MTPKEQEIEYTQEPYYRQVTNGMIRRHPESPSRYTVALACGPLTKPRYVNPKIEQELIEFKAEIKQKFHASEMNRTFKFPRTAELEEEQRRTGSLRE